MAQRGFMYCKPCEDAGTKVELISGNPEMHLFRCPVNGAHIFTYDQTASFTKIPMQFTEKMGPGDVKVDLFVDAEVLAKFKDMYPNRINATVGQILRSHLDGDLVIIDGMQARELKSLGIKNGAEMLAVAKNNQTMEDQLRDTQLQLETIRGLFTNLGVESPA